MYTLNKLEMWKNALPKARDVEKCIKKFKLLVLVIKYCFKRGFHVHK